jgi:hypothetical protein
VSGCRFVDTPDVELYFYDELASEARARVAAHLRECADCRARLDDLHAIRRALAAAPVVAAPPAGDWSGFMRRLDTAVGLPPAARPRPPLDVAASPRRRSRVAGRLAAYAAMLAVVAAGVFMAARVRPPQQRVAAANEQRRPISQPVGEVATVDLTPAAALRDVTAEHLERSKLVVLGLAARDPQTTRPADWQFERTLAGTLLPDTRLYRLAAQESGAADVAHVMRDLETVLLEASMTDTPDRASLERVQRLIQRRGLVTKMQVMANASGL